MVNKSGPILGLSCQKSNEQCAGDNLVDFGKKNREVAEGKCKAVALNVSRTVRTGGLMTVEDKKMCVVERSRTACRCVVRRHVVENPQMPSSSVLSYLTSSGGSGRDVRDRTFGPISETDGGFHTREGVCHDQIDARA